MGCLALNSKFFKENSKFHDDIIAGRTRNSWQVSFSLGGKYIAFAITASTRTPGLLGKRGEITNAMILFETNTPLVPLCTNTSTLGGNTLSIGACSVTFHLTEKKLLWTSMFVFIDRKTTTRTELLNFGSTPQESYYITGKMHCCCEIQQGNDLLNTHPRSYRPQIRRLQVLLFWKTNIRSPSQNGKPGFWDRLDTAALQSINFLRMDAICLAGIPLDKDLVIGVIPRDDGFGGIAFFKKTVL
jgi:hypothetical protein